MTPNLVSGLEEPSSAKFTADRIKTNRRGRLTIRNGVDWVFPKKVAVYGPSEWSWVYQQENTVEVGLTRLGMTPQELRP